MNKLAVIFFTIILAILLIFSACSQQISTITLRAPSSSTADLPFSSPTEPPLTPLSYITTTGITTSRVSAAANARAALTIPTYEGSGQAIHPSVLYFPTAWNGYHYWMAMTPFPHGDADYEYPSIVASNDGITWVEPPGINNPIGINYYGGTVSDPDLFYDLASDRLWLVYRNQGPGSTTAYYVKKTSSDGIKWSGLATILLVSPASEMISPALTKVDTTYYLYGVNKITGTNTISIYSSIDGDSFASYDEGQTVNHQGYMGKEPWHIEVRYSSQFGYVMLMQICRMESSGEEGQLMLFSSSDGLNWQSYAPALFLDGGGDGAWDQYLYRSTFALVGNELEIWYSANNGYYNTWGTGYTSVQLDGL